MLTRENLIGPWAGLPVSWTDDDRFDELTYRNVLQKCCQAGVPGVYTAGTTGEFYALEVEEFQHISRITVEVCHSLDTPVMIGCTATSTIGACRRAAYAAEIGADAIQLALPFWTEVQDAEVVPFFRDVAQAAPQLALSVYETKRAKKCLTVRQHREIHEAVPQYRMVKSNAGTVGTEPEGCESLSSFVNVFVSETSWSKLGRYGAIGSCSSMVYWNPRVVLQAWQHLKQHDWTALGEASRTIIALHDFLFEVFGPRGFTDTAYDRAGAHATGFVKVGLRARGPYGSPTTDDVRLLLDWLETHYPDMLEL